MNIKLTRLAEEDIDDIRIYTIKNWGYAQAEKYIDFIEDAYKIIQDNPYTLQSKQRNDLLENCRVLYVRKHVIIYLVEKELIAILRILHQSMDYKRHL